MTALGPLARRFAALAERLDALSIRERGLAFAAGVTVVYMAGQTLLLDPLTARERAADQRLGEARKHLAAMEQVGSTAGLDPLIAAAVRNRALKGRLTAIESQLNAAAQGYVAPQRMTDLLRQILAEQHGLKLISLSNLTVESLSLAAGAPGALGVPGVPGAPGVPPASPAANDRGPFLHPVEIVVEGDYLSLVAYLRALEALPWKIHWQQLELTAGDYPVNRVRLVIGALSLSRDWIDI